MVLIPIAVASMALTVWVNDVPDWQKGGSLAQWQFEYWYIQPLYPDDDIGPPPELVQSRNAREIAKLPVVPGRARRRYPAEAALAGGTGGDSDQHAPRAMVCEAAAPRHFGLQV